MRNLLLLLAITVLIHYSITDVETEPERRIGFPNISGITEENVRGPKRSTEHGKESNQGLKEMVAESGNQNPNIGEPIFKKNSGRQVFKDVIGGTRARRQVLKHGIYPNSTWNDGVFYTFNTSDSTMQKMFKMGAKVWSDNTCIDFMEDKEAPAKVVVIDDSSSFAEISRRGGDQFLSLGEYDPTGRLCTKLAMLLGFFHTMERFDRDNFIEINFANVDSDMTSEFDTVDGSLADVYGLRYDYGSVMHYDELSCTINGKPTMIAKDPYYQKTMGSELISFSDIVMINQHYGCNAKCDKSVSAKCVNEGFPHPRNCSICICPGGYGGALCDKRPSGCGKDLVATSKTKLVITKLGSGTGVRDEFSFCNYMITAPEGRKIAVDVRSISYGYDEGGCRKGGVEVKAQKDQKLTGYRFCSVNGSDGPIASSFNRLPVILFNRVGVMQTTFTYRLID